MEDAFALCDMLCDVTDKKQIKGVLQDYYQARLWRSAIVQGMSRFSSDIIINGFSTPFRLKEFLKEGLSYKYLSIPSILTWYLQSFLPIIFYAQFGYLYAFQPSSFDKATIDKLVEESKIRNKAEADNVYRTLKDGFNTFFTAKTMTFMRHNTATREISKIAEAKEMRCTVTDDVAECKRIPSTAL